jgi:hypothetical protein
MQIQCYGSVDKTKNRIGPVNMWAVHLHSSVKRELTEGSVFGIASLVQLMSNIYLVRNILLV